MQIFWLILAILVAGGFFYLFIRGPYKQSPLWLMLSAWGLALLIPRINLSTLELPLTWEFFGLVLASLVSFTLGFFFWKQIVARSFARAQDDKKNDQDEKVGRLQNSWVRIKTLLDKSEVSATTLRVTVYVLFGLSLVGLYLFYVKAGNFPLLAQDPDEFRFRADEQVPGLINYTAQLARLYIPLACFLIFYEGFKLKKHLDLILLSLIGTVFLILFASRTQIYFIDLWVMALYLFMRRPNLKQALKFYPIFLIISVTVLAAVPLVRQLKSYGEGYLAGITGIDASHLPKPVHYALPIYVGISFNMQALQHAQSYYETHELQYGKVTLDPFTNILGLDQFKSEYDLGEIFYFWWNTGTYLFPFVQDFGNWAFFIIPFFLAGALVLLWRFYQEKPNFLSLNLYAYACFFVVMTIYLSFTVRAEMYIDLFLLVAIYLIVSRVGKQRTWSI